MIYHANNHTGFGFRIGNKGCRYFSIWPLRWRLGIYDSEYFRRYCLGIFEITLNRSLKEEEKKTE